MNVCVQAGPNKDIQRYIQTSNPVQKGLRSYRLHICKFKMEIEPKVIIQLYIRSFVGLKKVVGRQD